MFIEYLQHLIYGYYPYLAGTVFLVGSLVRYDQGQFTWKTGSKCCPRKTCAWPAICSISALS